MSNEDLQIELNIGFNFSGLDEAIKSSTDTIFDDLIASELMQLRENIEVAGKEALSEMAESAQSLQEMYISLHGNIATGTLLGSITITGGDTHYEIGTNIEHFYPTVIEEGRGEVRPVNASVLHYITQSGEEVFSHYSRPVAPSPFAQPAFDSLTNQVDNILQGAFDNV